MSVATDNDYFRWQIPATFNFASDVVDARARESNGEALVWVNEHGDERRLTFSDVSTQSSQLAHLLAEQGVRQGDRVLVMLPRIPEWQITMVACHRMGAIPIPCITMLTASDVAYRVHHSEAIAVVTTQSEAHKFSQIQSLKARICVGGDVQGWSDYAACAQQPSHFPAALVKADDPAILYYTSGSTGNPKGVLHAARALYVWRNSGQYWLGLDASSTMWCTADTGWSKAGTSVLYGPWSQGARVLFYDGPFEPRERFKLIERYAVTCFCAAATEFRRLILESVEGIDLSSLQLAVSAGESVNPELIEQWQTMTGQTILDGYGQTEILMTVTNRPERTLKPGSMGRALPGVEVGVRSAQGDVLSKSAQGELVIRLPNPQLMLQYYKDAERSAQLQFEYQGERWFCSGDTVYIDDEGYVFYTGRTDDVISSAGYRIGPQEVENALSEHPAVQECAVAGVPDAQRGEIVKAWVVLGENFAPSQVLIDSLQTHTRQVTAPYKYPRQIEFVDSLPKTVTGKIQRNVLRERG